jgi:hypothetical protein
MVEIDVSVRMSFNNAVIFLWVQAYAEFVDLRRGHPWWIPGLTKPRQASISCYYCGVIIIL